MMSSSASPPDRPHDVMFHRPDRLLHWLDARRAQARLRWRQIAWDECTEWSLRDGALTREGGGFFDIRGFEWHPRVYGVARRHLPLIDQPEIGILGFLGRRTQDRKVELLVQAKTEPGNCFGTQLAPTVQATVSNYTRVHGGCPTPYVESFLQPDPATVSVDVKQSEQGTVFFGKHNRNVLIFDPDVPAEPAAPTMAWFPVADVLAALAVDFAVNTDARSVLCCVDWRELVAGGEPFARWRGTGGFGEMLDRSFASPHASVCSCDDWLADASRYGGADLRAIPLEGLRGWRRTPGGMSSDEDGSYFQLFDIEANDREVQCWQQPLVGDRAINRVVLICQERDGVLRFLVRVAVEPGLIEGTPVGPTGQSRGQSFGLTSLDRFATQEGTVVLAVDQSEEGGRFFRTVTRYEVRLLERQTEPPDEPGTRWLTLGELCRLVRRQSVLTNELRSALSLLLSLA